MRTLILIWLAATLGACALAPVDGGGGYGPPAYQQPREMPAPQGLSYDFESAWCFTDAHGALVINMITHAPNGLRAWRERPVSRAAPSDYYQQGPDIFVDAVGNSYRFLPNQRAIWRSANGAMIELWPCSTQTPGLRRLPPRDWRER